MSRSGFRRLLSAVSGPVMRKAAQAYVAGPEIQDAVRIVLQMRHRGFSTSIGFWDGESDTPRQVADAYRSTIRAISANELPSYISIKLPALAYSQELLGEVLSSARACGIRVHFDSLGPETADRTFKAIDEQLTQHSNVSLTLPGRWQRSRYDADWALERNLGIRIVKGQWEDASGLDESEGFANLVGYIAGRTKMLAIATHNPGLARLCFERLRALGTTAELELLFGLPERGALTVARDFKVAAAFYIPYGHAWLPYCLAQAKRNPRIFWWMIKDSLLPRFNQDVAAAGH